MGIAVAAELLRQNSAAEVCFAGSEKGIENRIIPDLGYRLETIRIGGLKNVGLLRTAKTLLQLPGAFFKSFRIVRNFSPSIIVSVGGYSAGPLALAGRILRIPVMLIEPNAYPGFTNRLLSRLAQGSALAWEDCGKFLRGRTRITGIPVRPEFHMIPAADSEYRESGPLRLLIFGGSQGSRPINRLVVKALPFLPAENFSIIHQTGPHDLNEVREGYARENRKDAVITEYITDMPEKFRWCDLILSRAGACTVAEVAAAGRASVLIPFPQAADNHQEKNAMAMKRRQASVCLLQQELTGEKLAEQLNSLAGRKDLLKVMARKARELARPDSSKKIIEFMNDLLGNNSAAAAQMESQKEPAKAGKARD
jgi:UDP-N-acetylglucosamine--N-acetylmuramyl-(pentapeptide) pyrophosphoryl-undecaprenol N-acetylglucosamine transferase